MDSSSNEKIKRYMKEDGIHFVPVWRIFGFSGANMAVNLYMGITMIMSYYLNGMEDLNDAFNQIKKY